MQIFAHSGGTAYVYEKKSILSCLAIALPSLYLLRLMQKKDPDTSESNVFIGGAYRDRTDDPLRARQVLSQLS